MQNPYAPSFPAVMPYEPLTKNARVSYTIPMRAEMCTVSRNPQPGSVIRLTPHCNGHPEVAAVVGAAMDAMAELVDGFDGDATRPPVRSMEAACAHIAAGGGTEGVKCGRGGVGAAPESIEKEG